MADRSVVVKLRAEIGQYKAQMAEAAKSTKGVSEEGKKASAEGKSFVDNWSKASGPLLAVGGAITAVGLSALKTGIAYNQLQQQSRAALTTILGSATAANAQMDKLDAFARTSPFSKSTFISAQQQMLAFGIEAQKVVPYLDAIQDAVAASGGGDADIAGVVATMSKVQSSAKLTAEDLNELGNRGINAAELIGSQMGKTGAQIREDITAGTLGADVALDALAAGMEQRFDGAADNVKNTFTGALDRISAAWRDLSSDLAEPFVGKEGGGIFTGLLNEGADLLRLVGELPGPVKATVGGVTMLAGAGMLAAGAFLVLAPRIVATRAALATLAADGSRAAVGLQRTGSAAATAGKSAGKFVAAAASLGLVVNAFSDSSVEGVNQWTEAILNGKSAVDSLSEGNVDNWFFGMGKDGLAGSIQDAEAATAGFNKVLGVFGLNMRERGANEVKAFDQALAGLVADGNLDDAAAGAEMFAREAKKGGVESKDAEKMLTAYNDALAKTRLDAANAADSTKTNAAATAEATEAHRQAIDAARGQAGAFVNLGQSLNDSKVSLGGWIAELEKNAKALDNFTSNAAKAINKGLDQTMVTAFKDAGTEGARRLAELADASEKQIERANKAWRSGRRNARDYVIVLAGVKPEVITQFKTAGAPGAIKTAVEVAREADLNDREVRTVLSALDYSSEDIAKVLKRIRNLDNAEANPKLNVQGASSALTVIRNVRGQLSALDGTGATVWIRERRTGGDHGGGSQQASANGNLFEGARVRKFADGGFDEFGRPVQRTPQIRSSSQGTVMWGEPETGWEAYVSGKPSQKPRNRAILSEAASRLGGNVEWFADGGFTEAVSSRELTGLQIRVRDLVRALKETEVVGNGKRKRKRLVLRKGSLDRLEAAQDLNEAKAELAKARTARVRMKKAGYGSADAYNEMMQKAQTDKENRQSVAGSFADRLDGDVFKSPASLERALSTMLRDSADFVSLLSDLKKKNVSPWLLDQLVKAGPSRATNRTMRGLLADADRLKRINASSKSLVGVSNSYAALTTGKGFTPTFSGTASLSQAQLTQITEAMSKVSINANVGIGVRDAGKVVQVGSKFTEAHA